MLHDPSHVPQIPSEEPIVLSDAEKKVLRELARQIAEIGNDSVNDERIKLWTAVNDLKSVRPVVWINEIPWHEMDVDGELTLRCEGAWARQLETELRRTIYQWRHMACDMVVKPYIECPKVYHSTDFGIVEKVDVAKTDERSEIYSRRFIPQIKEPEDIEKIKLPKITYMEKASTNALVAMEELFYGIIPVKQVGQSHIWYTPWDYLIRWWGVEQAMIDLYERPEMVHEAYERMVDAWMTELDQFDEMGLLELDCDNTRVGSGGYGYISSLPGEKYDGVTVHPRNMWGCSNAQIFSSVSPDMHWQFALEHDLRWLRRFGVTYYGCCEPLDGKMDILDRVPNLRKISCSAWCNVARMAERSRGKYVMSIKPSPAVFAEDTFNEDEARRAIRDRLEAARGCDVEIIMKDVSTVRGRPQNLWRWADIAMEEALRQR